jgi:sec-independent protein translocase protein TatC
VPTEEMELMDHLVELRRALVRAFVVIVVLFIGCFFFSEQILIYLKQPLLKVLPNSDLHFTGPLDVFIVSMKVSFLCALVLGAPLWIRELFAFVSPGLHPQEKKYVIPFMAISIILFYLGVAFCFFLILPMALEFLIGLGQKVGTPMITINDYISMLMILILGFGLVFETPLILVLFNFLGLVEADDLRKNRGLILVGILVFAAILTPPDPISQVAMAIPVYIMFEGSLLVMDRFK